MAKILKKKTKAEELFDNIINSRTGDNGKLSIKQIMLLHENRLLAIPEFQRQLAKDAGKTKKVRQGFMTSLVENRIVDFIQLDVNFTETKSIQFTNEEEEESFDIEDEKIVLIDGMHRVSEILHTFIKGDRWALKIPRNLILQESDDNLSKEEFFNKVKIVENKNSEKEEDNFLFPIEDSLLGMMEISNILREEMNQDPQSRVVSLIMGIPEIEILWVFVGSEDKDDQYKYLKELNTKINNFDDHDIMFTTLSSYGIPLRAILRDIDISYPLFTKWIGGLKELVMITQFMHQIQETGKVYNTQSSSIKESLQEEAIAPSYYVRNIERFLSLGERALKDLVDNNMLRNNFPANNSLSFKKARLIPFVLYLMVKGRLNSLKQEELEYFQKLYFSTALTIENKANSTHAKLKDVNALLELSQDTLNKTLQDLVGKTFIGDTHYNLLIFLSFLKTPVDWLNGTTIHSTNNDVHHIFPTNYLEKNNLVPLGYKEDSVLNLTSITSQVNRRIQDLSPHEYVAKLSQDSNNVEDNMRTHLIEPVFLKNGDYKAFLEHRGSQVVAVIQKYFGI